MNGHRIIALGFLFYIVCLYVTFLTNNTYANLIIFFFGLIITICICAIGCEKLEKNNESFDLFKIFKK